ncbi:MAG: 2-C-methyl-D-erythritol 2,4-cyclodiphosphate synthase [Gammaproteobacteria bacterium]|nr:2-C-methyl-D-erythritol 2,4-cyclodiphosphate synthase [Gammaproteobacteria bacterium]
MIINARIGHGYDVHAFCEGQFIVLGGVEIPFDKAFKAHSDGDVLIHALCDALLGAAGLGDIGQHFPDTDTQYKNMDSRVFLRQVYALIHQYEYRLVNADITIIAQVPKMMPHLHDMKINLTDDLECDLAAINIKATTTEQLGYIGREEGVAVHAVVLLEKIR